MPAKSRRKRSKNLPPSKRIKTGAGSSTIEAPESATESAEPVAVIKSTPVAGRKISPAAAEEVTYSYSHVKPELTRIGILAIVMLAILGILAAVL